MSMFARSNSVVLSIPSNSLYAEHFAFSQMPRSSEPEIFTFEESPAPQPYRSASVRHRKKNTRVMYPSKVRKYLPPAEKSPVKRWLLILCLVVCLQIYAEEGYAESPATATATATDSAAPESPAPLEDLSFVEYQVLPFRSAELHARQMKGESSAENAERPAARLLNRTCPGSSEEPEGAALYEQSSGSCYVMALLYPVYHRLGSEQ